MPELTEHMYAHQQICIPPMFPYLLRQYAKAAIRSQPMDLLKWSTAYFRALALSLPPPVKPRLEYPIPKTHYGLTPGWLKTLLRQLGGNETVSWPVLVDRWHGACLDICGLIEIILTAEFPNPAEIPWLKFVAVAAGCLTPNLTNTMILICELLTDEPEAGSAMIQLEIFIDLYRFLAELDASTEKIVRNFYYTESNLSLTKREPEETVASEGELRSTLGEMEQLGEETERRSESIKMIPLDEIVGEEQTYVPIPYMYPEQGEEEEEDLTYTAMSLTTAEGEVDSNVMIPPDLASKDSCFVILDDAEAEKRGGEPSIKEESSEESTETSSLVVSAKSEEKSMMSFMDMDLASMRHIPSHTGETTTESSETTDIGWTTVRIPAIPGIGPVVPEELIEAVIKYMKEVSVKQQGMVMPRNIKHFLCPPLEVLSTGNY